MKILVTNDDGINAEGIEILAKTARKFGEVIVIAPEDQCSAMSHHITLRDKMTIRKHDFAVQGVSAYAFGGTPADCVRASYLGLFKDGEKPDLVLSGVNKGANCGYDIQYSATVGAAMEALLYGVPAICFSQNYFTDEHECHTDVMHAHIEEILRDLISKPLDKGLAWNVNFPSCKIEDYKGILFDRFPAQSAFWDDVYVVEDNHTPEKEVVLKTIPIEKAQEGSDMQAVIDGYISIGTIRNTVIR